MTQSEAQAKTQEKLNAIQTLCKQLQMSVTAEEVIDNNGMIKKVVYYMDNEKYPIEAPKAEEGVPSPFPPAGETEKNA